MSWLWTFPTFGLAGVTCKYGQPSVHHTGVADGRAAAQSLHGPATRHSRKARGWLAFDLYPLHVRARFNGDGGYALQPPQVSSEASP